MPISVSRSFYLYLMFIKQCTCRSNLLSTRSNLLLTLRITSKILLLSLMKRSKRFSRKTLRRQRSFFYPSSVTSSCKSCVSMFLCVCGLKLLLGVKCVGSCLVVLLGRACMMMVQWSLLTTKKVLPTQHFCTSVWA